MTPSLETLGLDRLSLEERLSIAEALWDSVVRDAESQSITPAQRSELERRLADSIARPEAVVSWESVKNRALARRGS
jgi:putative addiction module component (TIGR02574 family)